MDGPEFAERYLSCNRCETDEFFVSIVFDQSVLTDFDYSAPDYTAIPDEIVVSEPVKC